MAWQTIDRRTPVADEGDGALLNEAMREKIRSFFARYETRRAALLPALHIVQNTLGHVSLQAMREIAELLEIPPSAVMDTLSFYTHFWDHPKGRKVVVACRSLSCQLIGADALVEAVKSHLNVEEHGTTEDGAYSFMTEECLATCDHGPCLLINEKLHKRVRPEDVPKLLKDASNDQLDIPRSDLFDPPSKSGAASPDDTFASTSDVQEMKES